MKTPRFELYPSKGCLPRKYRCWRWRLKGANGEIVAQGEAYSRKADCLRAARPRS